MTLEEVYKRWESDAKIDSSELGMESLRTPQVHAKWLRTLSEERLAKRKLETAAKALRKRKMQFYTEGPDEESKALGWRLPPRGRILKAEATGYVDTDPDVVAAEDALAYQVEVVDAVESIIKMINNRGFAIKNALDWNRFINGG